MRYESVLHDGPGDSRQNETQLLFSSMQTAQTKVLRLQQQTTNQNTSYDTLYLNLFGTIFCRLVAFKIALLVPRKNIRLS